MREQTRSLQVVYHTQEPFTRDDFLELTRDLDTIITGSYEDIRHALYIGKEAGNMMMRGAGYERLTKELWDDSIVRKCLWYRPADANTFPMSIKHSQTVPKHAIVRLNNISQELSDEVETLSRSKYWDLLDTIIPINRVKPRNS